MEVKIGEGKTEFGTGIQIDLSGEEVARAISSYLVSHGVYIRGARTITINGNLCENGSIYVDPSGFVMKSGQKYSGRKKKME